MLVDETEFFDVCRCAFTEGDQHVILQRLAGAVANLGDGGLENGIHNGSLANEVIGR